MVNGGRGVRRVPMIRILFVRSLRNGRAGRNGPDRNGSCAAERNEFDAGNVRGPNQRTRSRERGVEGPGGGPGSAVADQLTELLETTVHGRSGHTRAPVAAREVEAEARRAGRPPRTDPCPGSRPGRRDPARTILLPWLRIRPHRRCGGELFPPAGLRPPTDK